MTPVPIAQPGERGVGARLESLIRSQHALFVELESLVARQNDLIESDTGAPLLAHLDQRRAIVDELVRVSQELEPYRARADSLLSLVPDGQARSLRDLLDEIAAIAQRVRQADEHGQERLRQRRAAVAQRLDQLDHARNAGAAYGAAPASAPRLQDREA